MDMTWLLIVGTLLSFKQYVAREIQFVHLGESVLARRDPSQRRPLQHN